MPHRAKDEEDDIFGDTRPELMPDWLFSDSLWLNYYSAIRARIDKQNYTICPRNWYIDAGFTCAGCRETFIWSAREQKAWFESYHFYVDSQPKLCKVCARQKRRLEGIQKAYNAKVEEARNGGSADQKREVIRLIDELEEGLRQLPEKIFLTRDILRREVANLEKAASEDERSTR
jgi:hypothetical protein